MTGPTNTDLAAWLLEQIAEEERGARLAAEDDVFHRGPPGLHWRAVVDRDDAWVDGDPASVWDMDENSCTSVSVARHIARYDPARVLAECEAKRRIIKLYTNALAAHLSGSLSRRNQAQDEAAVDVLGRAVRELALPFAAHPGYRSEWAP